MVMEATQPRRRFGTRLSLRSAQDVELVRRVVRFCADNGVRHKALLHAALSHAMEDARILEAARLREIQAQVEMRRSYRDRARWYRGRRLL